MQAPVVIFQLVVKRWAWKPFALVVAFLFMDRSLSMKELEAIIGFPIVWRIASGLLLLMSGDRSLVSCRWEIIY